MLTYYFVIDIDQSRLPSHDEVENWTAEQYASALRRDQTNPAFHPTLAPASHVEFKIAAELRDHYLTALSENAGIISRNPFSK